MRGRKEKSSTRLDENRKMIIVLPPLDWLAVFHMFILYCTTHAEVNL
jgi:hypothetical protein